MTRTHINFEELNNLKNMFEKIGNVEVGEPKTQEYRFVVTWSNIFNCDGSNVQSLKKYIAESEDEARQDLNKDIRSLSHLGYELGSVVMA